MALNDALGAELGVKNAFTVHQVNGKRYYSSMDASIYFDDTEIEEIVQIQWTEQQQTLPLYGYNSYVFDEVAQGSRIIQGQFAINFTVPDYLNAILKEKKNDSTVNYTTFSSVHDISDQHAPHFNYSDYRTGFTICIGFGYGKNDSTNPATGKYTDLRDSLVSAQPCIFLEKVFVQSCGMAHDTQGQGLVEIYSFIAQDKNISR